MHLLTTILCLLWCLPGSLLRDTFGCRVLFEDPVAGITTRYYYDGPNVIEERNGADVRVRYHVAGAQFVDEHIASFDDSSGIFVYYLSNDLYTVAAIGSASGSVFESYNYGAYGLSSPASSPCIRGDMDGDSTVDAADLPQFITVLLDGTTDPHELCAADLNGDFQRDGRDIQPMVNCILNAGACPPVDPGSPSVANPFFFTGQRLDALDPTGGAGGNPSTARLFIYDYKARVFDPKHGRFQERDPAEFADAYNLYEYAASRPTIFTDPTGRQFSTIELTVTTAIQNGLRSLPLPGLAAALAAAKQVAFFASAIATAVAIDILLIERSSRERTCRCSYRPLHPGCTGNQSTGGPCPDRVFATGPFRSIGECQAVATASARPVNCIGCYAHCSFIP